MGGGEFGNELSNLGEGENAAPEQIKMLLTRMGQGSKVVVNGDVTQIDLVPKKTSGLVNLPQILKDVPGVEVIQFTSEDVVRHALIKEILKAYESWESQQEPR